MDTVTQMLLGATVAQAGFRARFGRRSLAVGALLALVPDLDVAAGWLGGPFTAWLHHRGLTHSILFGPPVGLLAGWLIWRWHRARRPEDHQRAGDGTLRAWIWLAVLALMTHPVIDIFTSYGTQWLYPLSRERLAVNAMPILDPLYSLILLGAVAFGALARARPRRAQDVAGAALILVSAYTGAAWAINTRVETFAREQVAAPWPVAAYPTLFQPVLRRVVVDTPDGLLVGFHSVLSDAPIAWEPFARETGPAIDRVAATPEAAIFRWFALGRVHWQTERLPNGDTRVRGLDTRYGMPGPTAPGMWGIEAVVAATGEIRGEILPFRTRPDASCAAWGDLWRRIRGRPAEAP
jgi:inner membrane protein